VAKNLQRDSGTPRTRMGHGIQHPVPVEVFYWSTGRFETVLAVNYASWSKRSTPKKLRNDRLTLRADAVDRGDARADGDAVDVRRPGIAQRRMCAG
jgi:hypothetical protein